LKKQIRKYPSHGSIKKKFPRGRDRITVQGLLRQKLKTLYEKPKVLETGFKW
jgi:hypothetical protein